MPYKVSDVRERVKSTKNLTDKELEQFVAVANEQIKSGASETKAIKIAFGAVRKAKLKKSFESFIDLIVGDASPDDTGIEMKKALSEELMQEVSVVYPPNTLDGHGHWMSEETVSDLCQKLRKGFLEDNNLELNLWHDKSLTLPKDEVEVIDVSLTKSEMYVDDIYIPKGTCIMALQYHNERLWEMRKEGVIGGLSVDGRRDFFPGEKQEV